MFVVNNPSGSSSQRIETADGVETLPPGVRREYRYIQNLRDVVENCMVKQDGEMVQLSDLDDSEDSEDSADSSNDGADDSDDESTEEPSEEDEEGSEEEESDEKSAESDSTEETSDEDAQNDESVDLSDLDWNTLRSLASDNDVEGSGSGRGREDIEADLRELDELDLSAVTSE